MTLEEPGTYALRLDVAGRRYWSWIRVQTCVGLTGKHAAIRLSTNAIVVGAELPYELQNTGAGCLAVGVGYQLDQLQPDGQWLRVTNLAFPLGGTLLAPGQHFKKQLAVPAEFSPGTYRVVDTAITSATAGGQGPRIEIPLTASFTVLPR